MLRSSLIAASAAILCCATASGQQQQIQARQITAPVKHLGIYHVATKTWTRGIDKQGALGPDVVYRADCSSGYFGVGWECSEGVDEIIIPGPTNPNPGTAADVQVNGYEWGYCSLSTGPVCWTFKFYESYVPCDDPDIPVFCQTDCPPANSFGCLPGGTPSGGINCWLFTVDLMGGYEMCLGTDGGACNPGYDGGGQGFDYGGIGTIWATLDGNTTGPFLDGYDVDWCNPGGTCAIPGFTAVPCPLATTASGYGAQDFFGVGTPFFGCFFFQGYKNINGCGLVNNTPGAQFHTLLFANANCSACSGTECNYSNVCVKGILDTDMDGLPDAIGPTNLMDVALDNCVLGDGSLILFGFACGSQFDGNIGYPIVSVNPAKNTAPSIVNGTLCIVGTGPVRYNKDFSVITSGAFTPVDLLNSVTNGSMLPVLNVPYQVGTKYGFQWWHRDMMDPSRYSRSVSVVLQ
jgi:hypothetical protein